MQQLFDAAMPKGLSPPFPELPTLRTIHQIGCEDGLDILKNGAVYVDEEDP